MSSNCCQAQVVPESDVCSDCLEHCEDTADYVLECLDIEGRTVYLNGKEVKDESK